jgi:LPS export ABC transporter protein LptC
MSKKSMLDEASSVTNISNRGFSLYETTIHITNNNGQLIYSIIAEKAYEDPTKKLLKLDDVSINYMKANQGSWSLKADSGVISEDKINILLQGNVTIINEIVDRYPNLIWTDELNLKTEGSLISSESLVKIFFKDGNLETNGIAMDLDEGILNLKSSIYGKFNY